MSQEDLAARAEVSRSTIQNIEAGRRKPQPASLKRIARALGTDLAALTREPVPPGDIDELKALREMLQAALDRIEEIQRGR